MRKNAILVDRIDLSAFVSDEQDPYGQKGFSTLTAEIITKSEEIIAALKLALNKKEIIAVRCARLEVQGRVFKCGKSFRGFEAVIGVDDLQLVK
jgi:hypothetical protein